MVEINSEKIKKSWMFKEKNKYFIFALSICLSILISAIVYYTGGTTRVYANLMYIPITISASIISRKIGVFQAAFSAMLVGPMMPLNTEFAIAQSNFNWMMRLVIYITVALVIGVFSDLKGNQERSMKEMLMIDSISGFKTVESLKQSPESNLNSSYIAFKIKNYEMIFDYFGYEFSNQMIKIFSKEIKNLLKEINCISIYRIKGLEYLITISECDYDLNIDSVINQLMKTNKMRLKVFEVPIYLEIVIGATSVNESSALEGFRHAMIAQNYAERKKVSRYIYIPKIEEEYQHTIEIASSFQEELSLGNIVFAHQNIYEASTNKIVLKELLARWVKSDGSLLPPDSFIPILEQTDHINLLLKYNIDVAIKMIENQVSDTIISINWSIKNFSSENVSYIIDKVKESGVSPSLVQIELTEGSFVDSSLMHLIYKLKYNGFMLSIDDFGTGFSSYHYLGILPLDIIKIDKSLIKEMLNNKKIMNIVIGIIGFCRENGLKTIVEGVETKEISDVCKSLGADYLQGYYYHKPEIKKLDFNY